MMAPRNAGTTARATTRRTRHAATNPWLELLQRFGYVVRGVLYAVMGLLALGVALGVGGQATDQKGSLVVLVGNPLGKPILIAVVIGLAAYSTWGFVRAAFDPLHRGHDAGGVADRLGFLWSGFAYAALTVFALQFLAAGQTGAQGDTTPTMVAKVLAQPAGGFLTVVGGLVAIAAGLGQFVEAWRARFRKDLKRAEMSRNERRLVEWLGRSGMVARGVTFTLVGWFLVDAGIHQDAGRAHGFGGAFTFLLTQPYGRLLVGLLALGFVALGLHSFAAARWMRLMGSGG
jgi:Domain of Unknown Function (DUF1206)